MILEEYVTFEVAKLLKEKGFDVSCWNVYDKDGYIVDRRYPTHQSACSNGECLCPTQQRVMKWLREEKNIAIETMFNSSEHLWYACVKPMASNPSEDDYYRCFSEKYEDAVEAAIKYCPKNLIL